MTNSSGSSTPRAYGQDDASYQAAGGLPGITSLVDEFYQQMDSLPVAKVIRDMHPQDLALSRKKLTYFLSGWLGGPKLFSQHFGSIRIPVFHRFLDVGVAERDAWMECMTRAIEKQDFAPDFKHYLAVQLMVPAERVRMASENRKQEQEGN
ncbi:MAG: group II truncated hemoglobin [Oceanococcus sp.]